MKTAKHHQILRKTLILFLVVLFFGLHHNLWPDTKKILEEVDVTNVQIALRVFLKGKPVTGLKKEDFKLFVNQKEKAINGFNEIQKQLNAPVTSPRMFVLMVNICDYHLDIEKVLEPLFQKVIRPNDHIILITNNFFIEDRHIPNPQEELEKIKGTLQLELGKITPKLRALELRMKSLMRLYKSRGRINGLKSANNQDFMMDYIQLVQEYKNLFMDLGNDNFIRLAHHLKSQSSEKWVISFYQVGKFFKPKIGSEFFKSLMGSQGNTTELFGSYNAMQWYERLQETLEPKDALIREDLIKLFISTGATFHTALMEHGRTMQNRLAEDLSYAPVISDSYNLLKELSERTGGIFINAKNIEQFYRKIYTNFDTHYLITFVPDNVEEDFKDKIKIIVNNQDKRYKIFYDSLKRSRYVENQLKKVREESPQIHVGLVDFNDNRLSFVVSNFKKNVNSPGNPDAVTKLPVRIQVFNKKSQSLFDGVKMYEFTADQLKDKEARVRLQVDFPDFPPGDYDVFIWVGDSQTGKRNLAIKGITVTPNPY